MAALLVMLVLVLASLEGTRDSLGESRVDIGRTEARLDQLARGLQPLVEATSPLAADGARRGLLRASRDAVTAAGLIPEVADNARRAGSAATTIAADLEPALTAVRALAGAGIPALRDLSPRLVRLLEWLRSVNATLDASLATQQATRDLTVDTVTLFRESLVLQRELLVHVRSLDSKLGGTVASP